jgi:hypothetical protein
MLNHTFSCPYLLCFSLVLLTAARSTIYLLSPRFHQPSQRYFHALLPLIFPFLARCSVVYNLPSLSFLLPSNTCSTNLFHAPTSVVSPCLAHCCPVYNLPSLNWFHHHDQRYFSCPYCLCFPLVLLHADLSLQFTFSQLVFTHPETPCYNTSHARRQGEKKKKTAFVFPLSRSLLSYNRPSFSPTLLSDTFSCPYCLCFSLLTAVRSTIFLLNSFALPSKHHPQRYFFMSPLSLFQMSCSMLPSLCNLPSLNSFSRTL